MDGGPVYQWLTTANELALHVSTVNVSVCCPQTRGLDHVNEKTVLPLQSGNSLFTSMCWRVIPRYRSKSLSHVNGRVQYERSLHLKSSHFTLNKLSCEVSTGSQASVKLHYKYHQNMNTHQRHTPLHEVLVWSSYSDITGVPLVISEITSPAISSSNQLLQLQPTMSLLRSRTWRASHGVSEVPRCHREGPGEVACAFPELFERLEGFAQ